MIMEHNKVTPIFQYIYTIKKLNIIFILCKMDFLNSHVWL